MANPLIDIIPASGRKYVYSAYALASLVVGSLAVAGAHIGAAPEVVAYVGAALGLVAASNTSAPSAPAEPDSL